jgi:LacI family transcriptional regulator
MQTIKDVAKHSGLAYATISKYLNGGNVLPENREKIETAIRELNFTVNEFARGLKTNKSNTVGIIVPDIGNVYVALTIPIIVDELRKSGYATIICDSRAEHEREAELIRFSMGKRVDGIINMPVGADGSHLLAALDNHIPVVLLDRIVTDCIGRVDAVLVDNARAAQDAAACLIEHGHTEIGVIAGPRDVYTAMERLSGYVSTLRKNRLEVKDSLIEYTDFSIESGYRACKRLLKNNPGMTALFTTNYDVTVGAMMAINERGISVPDSISVFGFDDMPFAQVIKPHLSVIAQPFGEIGKHAAQLLLDRMSGRNKGHARVMVLHTQSVMRDSVGTKRQSILREDKRNETLTNQRGDQRDGGADRSAPV